MKIVRKIEGLGRMVIPKAIREHMGLTSEDSIEFIVMENGEVMIKKFAEVCVFCGSKDGITGFGGAYICQNCVDKMKSDLKSTVEKIEEEQKLFGNCKILAEVEAVVSENADETLNG